MTRSRSHPQLRADVFPARLTVAPAPAPDSPQPYRATTLSSPPPDSGARTLTGVRVVVTLEQVLVFQDSSQGPQLIFSEPLLDYTPPGPRPQLLRNMHTPREATLTTESGKTLAFTRAGGCGCGSRLKSFQPFGANTQYLVASTQDALPSAPS